MATVVISGLPQEVKLSKLLVVLRSIFRKNIRLSSKFWVSSSSDIPDTEYKEVTIKLSNLDEAFVVAELLDNFQFESSNATYNLTAYVDTNSIDIEESNQEVDSGSPFSDRRMPSKPRWRSPEHSSRYDRHQSPVHSDRSYERRHSRERYRSRSPRRDVSELDLELELLRKQRMVIEEERRLLLERRKLEMAQDYRPRPSTSKDRGIDFDRRRRASPPRRERPRSRSRTRYDNKPTQREPRFLKAPDRLPRFTMPCKFLLKEMQPLIAKYAKNTDKKMLENFIRLKLRKQIAVALENQNEYLPSKAIFKLYRSANPPETDKSLVETCAKSIEDSHLPQLKNKVTTEEKKQKKEHEKEVNWYIDTAGESVANLKDKSSINIEGDTNADDAVLDEEFGADDVEDWAAGGTDWNDMLED